MNLVARDLKQIFQHPYNKQHRASAYFRYLKYLFLKVLKRKQKLNVWKHRKLFFYPDSVQSTWLLFNYIIDWEEFNLIEYSLKDDSTFVDVGANIGYYSIWASQFIDGGKIFSFEPNKKNFARLKENIQINNLENVIFPIEKAVSEKNGFVTMTTGLDTLNHLASDSSENENFILVPSITLDEWSIEEKINFIDYLKIDVEGFELNVLQGASELLKQKKIGVLQLEINNAVINSGHQSQSVIELLMQNGYSLCTYDVPSKKLLPVKYSPDRENYFATVL